MRTRTCTGRRRAAPRPCDCALAGFDRRSSLPPILHGRVAAHNGPATTEDTMGNPVTETAAATPAQALEHFGAQFAFEADCWDVHEALSRRDLGFRVLRERRLESRA